MPYQRSLSICYYLERPHGTLKDRDCSIAERTVMNPQRCPRLSPQYSIAMVLLVALLTTPVMARNEGRTIQEPAEPQPQADTALPIFVVGDGTPASCTKDAIQFELWAALAASGGRVFFNCGPGPVTIPIGTGSSGQPLSFFNNTTLDGSGRITLAIGSGPSMVVDIGATVVMRNLTITTNEGLANHAILNLGDLTVWECEFHGYAIRSMGSLNIVQSTFFGSGAFLLSAVVIQSGTGSVRRSTIDNGGTLDIAGSRFIGNAADFGGGGAIANVGVLTIENSEFAGNVGFTAGAVLNQGSLTATNTMFANNRATGPGGGGILGLGGGTIVIRHCDFLNNEGGAFGGALFVSGNVTIDGGTFSGNHAGQGGAIYTSADPLTIHGSVIITNKAEVDGGGIFVAAGSLVQDHNAFLDNFPNDIGPAVSSISTAASSSTVDPEALNTWLRNQVMFSLTASPQEIAARRAGPQTQQK
jgi:hypothetical protein